MTVEEVQHGLGLSRNGVYEAIRRKEIPSVRIGRRIIVPRAAYLKMLDACQEAK
jgi:excisionase family DNA binding protein